MKVKKSLNVIFNETPTPYKTSPLEDDDLVEEEAIEVLDKCLGLGYDRAIWILVRCDEIIARTLGHAPLERRDESKFLYFVYTGGNGIDVVVPKESIRAISERSSNIAYGFLLGKRVAYIVVANYGTSSYARAMIELRADVELKENIMVPMPKITKEDFYTCNMGFKPTKQQVYQPISKKPTANTCENKKKNMEPTKEVSKLNSFDVLTLVENDVELDNEGKPLEKVDDDHDDEVSSTDNEMASFLSKMDGYGTQSLLGQWKNSYEDDDYEYDLYDDDMYERHKIPEKLQAFCDNLDIKVRSRKKK
uniref:Uncharacterized protein n=1 Tax=Tanacetum cinerariifolium TaxID=118510 RepID=A0A6L2J5X0_TANCI|nr:hypothetical protein [Tanacetum cinerariifolium]